MLVVESVVPGGPADGVLEPGDVLVSEVEARGLSVWSSDRMKLWRVEEGGLKGLPVKLAVLGGGWAGLAKWD